MKKTNYLDRLNDKLKLSENELQEILNDSEFDLNDDSIANRYYKSSKENNSIRVQIAKEKAKDLENAMC